MYDDSERLLHDADALDDDVRSRLDKTIDRIGMGRYQWTLLCLCGCGWLADNMWLQAAAIVLPRVQQHYSVPDNWIGAASAAMFAGMLLGAVGWGTCSDLLGRSTAFNATLVFTALFGLLASLSWSFTSLAVILFLLGTAVGGSMPTDGTLIIEHLPQPKLYLVTALSIFFSVGSVVAAVFALFLVPQNSCAVATIPCDPALNNGWKHYLGALGIFTLAMFIARVVFFRLHESPRFLVHAGRPAEALVALQAMARFNGNPQLADELDLPDVDDSVATVVEDDASYMPIGNGDTKSGSRWLRRLQMVLEPEWRRTSLLIWGAWCGMALAYTMFNVYLPKLLESKGTTSIEASLWDVLIFTIGGCPGAFVGAKLILTPLGRRWSLAGSTIMTAVFCLLFVFAQKAQNAFFVRISATGVGLASTVMWSILYGWTPEIFATKVRGTACGMASGFSRIGGVLAPILGGMLLLISRAAPVYTSMVVFLFAAACVLMLSENEGESGRTQGGRPVVVH
ncbi:MFS general substrate transporter [Roridomyces roridus]|uniref:MFS general substrate transporter n=1 Tax=Roridomyces roridus TaxID=1738132 RepID=A0AAD7FZU6_9AGAR|nr:MFS general substrate transporter [Roridomyces roridus]